GGDHQQSVRAGVDERRERSLSAVTALTTIDCCLPALTAVSTSAKLLSIPTELLGSKSSAIFSAFGTISRRTSSRFAPSSRVKKFTPVTLPPGLLILSTRPAATGSPALTKTIGVVAVAPFAACVGA